MPPGILIMKAQEAPKITQAIAIAFGCPPELDG